MADTNIPPPAGHALPYIDKELDAPGMREHVRQLIEQEMRTFRPAPDAVAHIRVPELALEVRASAPGQLSSSGIQPHRCAR